MRLLVLTTVLPTGRRTGGEIVTHSIVEALGKAGHDVRVLGYRRPVDKAPPSTGEICAGRRPIETSSAGSRPLAWMGRALASRLPYSAAKYDSRAYMQSMRRALREGPAAVIADHAQVHFAIGRAGPPEIPMVFVAHNAESQVYARLAVETRNPVVRWAYGREARLIGGLEGDLARRAGQIWTLTPDEAVFFRSLCPGADVRTLEVASEVGSLAVGRPAYDVALLGSWSWQANERGLAWFSDEVVPRLRQDLSIEVAGMGGDWLRGRHPNVSVRGFVPDAQRFLALARVVAVPAIGGGGVQVKMLDAIASGVPVVATSAAVRGLEDLPPSVAVADEAEQFALELMRFAADTLERPLADALAWSHARRAPLETAVAAWIAELTEEGGGGRQLAVEEGRGRKRPG